MNPWPTVIKKSERSPPDRKGFFIELYRLLADSFSNSWCYFGTKQLNRFHGHRVGHMADAGLRHKACKAKQLMLIKYLINHLLHAPHHRSEERRVGKECRRRSVQ